MLDYGRLCEDNFKEIKLLEKCLTKCKQKMPKKFIKNLTGDFIKLQKNDKDRLYIIENFE